jgi:hypothetical protein
MQKVDWIRRMSLRIAGWLTERRIGGCLVLILAAPTAKAAATPLQAAAPAAQEQSAPLSATPDIEAGSGNGKPTVDSAQPTATLPDAPEVAQSPSAGSNEQNGSSQPRPGQQQFDQQQNGAAPPVGTAVAPSEAATGVAASKPAGAAIAPAKQRRVRIFLISLGVVAAACVAIGTVAGLSRTSPSQPK